MRVIIEDKDTNNRWEYTGTKKQVYSYLRRNKLVKFWFSNYEDVLPDDLIDAIEQVRDTETTFIVEE